MSYKELPGLPPWAPMAEWGEEIVKEVEGAPLAWSGEILPPPPIGSNVYVSMNALKWGEVKGYAAVDGYLALRVVLKDPPEWHLKQNGPNCISCVFGAEIREVQP